MPITPTPKIWMNGEMVDWDAAQVHILTHSLHYGMAVFEGIRAYETDRGAAVFRLTDHIERLHRSARMMLMDMPYSVEELVDATKRVVRESGLPSCYIRPSPTTATARWGSTPSPAPPKSRSRAGRGACISARRRSPRVCA